MSKNCMDGPTQVPVFDDENCIWVEEFTDRGVREFYNKFMQFECDSSVAIIPIVVSSHGGEVHCLLAMRDLIKSSCKMVATIALGKAMSAGASLVASGTPGLRFASPDTCLLIHEMSAGSIGKTQDIQVNTKAITALNKLLLNNLANDIGKPVKMIQDKLDALKNADWFLTAPQAKKLGLIDHIGIPRIMEQASMKMLAGGPPFTKDAVRPVNPGKHQK